MLIPYLRSTPGRTQVLKRDELKFRFLDFIVHIYPQPRNGRLLNASPRGHRESASQNLLVSNLTKFRNAPSLRLGAAGGTLLGSLHVGTTSILFANASRFMRRIVELYADSSPALSLMVADI
jgi:hypothetical protein